MTNLNLKYPVIVFDKHNDSMSSISSYKKRFFITTREMIGFYTNIEVIDSLGNKYEIKKAEFEKNIIFSLLYLKMLVKVKPILKKPLSKISLDDLKVKAMNQVKLKPKFWLPVDTIEGIQEMVDNAKTYKELILIFK